MTADYRAAAREAAARHGVPAEMFVNQITQESNWNPNAVSPSGATGLAQFMPATAASFGIDPLDPIASLDAAAAYMDRLYRQYGSWRLALAAYNAGPGNVQTYGGVPPFAETQHYLDVILGPGWPEPTQETALTVPSQPKLRTTDDLHLRESPTATSRSLAVLPHGTTVEPLDTRAWRRVRANGVDGWVAADYLENAPGGVPALAYNPDAPLYLQRNDYTCSIAAVINGLRQIGVGVTPEDAFDAMVPEYVNADDGLKDGSGAGIVKVLRDHWGIEAHAISPASWEDVTAAAGKSPVLLGGHGWGGVGHWVSVRDFDGENLILANPGGTGPRFGQQTIDRATWDTLASWWSAVVIDGRAA